VVHAFGIEHDNEIDELVRVVLFSERVIVTVVLSFELSHSVPGTTLAVGAVRSTTIVSACDATDSPLAPVAFAVTAFVPAGTVPSVHENAPDPFAVHAEPELAPST
jgi:hypothetical protein